MPEIGLCRLWSGTLVEYGYSVFLLTWVSCRSWTLSQSHSSASPVCALLHFLFILFLFILFLFFFFYVCITTRCYCIHFTVQFLSLYPLILTFLLCISRVLLCCWRRFRMILISTHLVTVVLFVHINKVPSDELSTSEIRRIWRDYFV